MADKRSRGRPSTYSPELAADICRRLASGETLRAVCRNKGMPSEAAVRGWALDDVNGFASQYARAREIGYQTMADEVLEIADDGRNDWVQREGPDGSVSFVPDHEHIHRSRLRVDTRKWLLSKALPKIYGERITQEHTGPDGSPLDKYRNMSEAEIDARLQQIMAQAGAKSTN